MVKLAIVTNATTTGVIGQGLPISDEFVTEYRARLGGATAAEAADAFLAIALQLAKAHLKSRFVNEDLRAHQLEAEAAFESLLPG